MNDTVFDPTDKKLTLKTSENHVSLWLDDELLSQCDVEGCDQWTDSRKLAYFYLEARVNNGCLLEPKYNESIFTLILNTLKAQTGQEDFLTADWQGVSYECVDYETPQPVYSTFTTTDGYDLTVRYMSPGVAWRETVVRSEDTIPTAEEMYNQLFNGAEKEWVSNGMITHDGMTYSFDQAASALFTVNRRLQIRDETGKLIYDDEDVKGLGIVDAAASLHRQMQLGMWYGAIAEVPNELKLTLSNNVAHLLQDMFGMGEYLELEDGASHSIRGSVDDLQCLISHTYMAEANKVRADFRFFTNTQPWSIEFSDSFSFDEPPMMVVDVYNRHRAQIRGGLGLDLPEAEIHSLGDIPFENRDVGYESVMQPFTPVTPEEEAAYYQDEEEDMAGDPLMVTQVVAVGPRGGIGMGNDLLFRIKEDLRFFKQVTTDHVVIMGRKTFESIGRPLPNRQNIVVTTDPEYVLNLYTPENDQQYDNLHCVTSIEEAVMLGGRLAMAVYGNNELMVIGGAGIYQQFMPMTQRILMTSISNGDDSHADVFYPLTGEDIQREWFASVINSALEEDGLQYERYELTRKS